jgi:ribonuclease Z
MTHYVPALVPGHEEQWRTRAASEFGGQIELANDPHRVEVN